MSSTCSERVSPRRISLKLPGVEICVPSFLSTLAKICSWLYNIRRFQDHWELSIPNHPFLHFLSDLWHSFSLSMHFWPDIVDFLNQALVPPPSISVSFFFPNSTIRSGLILPKSCTMIWSMIQLWWLPHSHALVIDSHRSGTYVLHIFPRILSLHPPSGVTIVTKYLGALKFGAVVWWLCYWLCTKLMPVSCSIMWSMIHGVINSLPCACKN